MTEYAKEIAKVESVTLGREDHGILTCWLMLSYGGGSGQGAGGYALDGPTFDEDGEFLGRRGSAFGMQFVERLMNACGVDEWSKITGRTVYALRDKKGYGGKVVGIAPLPTEPGEPFVFDELVAEHSRKETPA